MSALKKSAVCFGEILWDMLPSGAKPGGAPMNVAYHLNQLGVQTNLISRVGNDQLGSDLLMMLEKRNLFTGNIQKDVIQPTGIVHASIGENHEVSYDIVYPVAWDYIEWEERFSELVQQADILVYGSLGLRHEVSRNTLFKLLDDAKTRVFDINLRPPYIDRSLIEQLLYRSDILKLNEHELPILGKWFSDQQDREAQIIDLSTRFKIPMVIVTMGGEGSMLYADKSFFIHKGYKVKVADTVGSGDAFLASFLYKTLTASPFQESVSFANAMGAFVATKNGACPEYKIEEIELLMKNEPALNV